MTTVKERLLKGAQERYAADAAKRAEEKAAALAQLEAAKKKKAGGNTGQGSSADTIGVSRAVAIDPPTIDEEAPAPTPTMPIPAPRLGKARAYDITD